MHIVFGKKYVLRGLEIVESKRHSVHVGQYIQKQLYWQSFAITFQIEDKNVNLDFLSVYNLCSQNFSYLDTNVRKYIPLCNKTCEPKFSLPVFLKFFEMINVW